MLRKLAKKYGLKKVGRDKACIYVEDQTLGKRGDTSQLNLDEQALEAARVLVYKEKRLRICFVFLGENLLIEQRIQEFSTPGDLSKHFRRRHLQHIKEGDSLGCKLCQVSLAHKMHLQRHALEVHDTVS